MFQVKTQGKASPGLNQHCGYAEPVAVAAVCVYIQILLFCLKGSFWRKNPQDLAFTMRRMNEN